MFLGRFQHTIDDRGRLTLPAKYSSNLAAGVVVTRGIDRCLYIYPKTEWQRLAQKIGQLSLTDKDARALLRFFVYEASDSIPDKEGRVLIPTYLREYAHLGSDAIVTGSHDHLEVWNPEVLEGHSALVQQDMEAAAEKLGKVGML